MNKPNCISNEYHNHSEEWGERERIQGTMNTVFCCECVVLDKVWEKGKKKKKNPKQFIVINFQNQSSSEKILDVC